jgi:hypothetical protein
LFQASKALFKLKSVRTDPHHQEETCLAHRPDICLSTADLPLSIEEAEKFTENARAKDCDTVAAWLTLVSQKWDKE